MPLWIANKSRCGEDEKFLLAYIIFKLKLVKGKCIIFVGDVDRCYRLKLFFEQFGIRSCILNSELPVNSRIHVVEEFNRNVYDIIIASDEKEILGNEGKAVVEDEQEEAGDEAAEAKKEEHPKKKRKASKRDLEYGVSRGQCLPSGNGSLANAVQASTSRTWRWSSTLTSRLRHHRTHIGSDGRLVQAAPAWLSLS